MLHSFVALGSLVSAAVLAASAAGQTIPAAAREADRVAAKKALSWFADVAKQMDPHVVDDVHLLASAGRVLLIVPPAQLAAKSGPTPSGILGNTATAAWPGKPLRLISVSADDQTSGWEATAKAGPHLHTAIHDGKLYIGSSFGGIQGFDWTSGRPAPPPHLIASRLPLNYAACPLPDGRFASCSISQLQVAGADGVVLWQSRSRAGRGINPPCYTCLAATGDGKQLMAGLTDGSIEFRDLRTGALSRRVPGLDATFQVHPCGATDAVVVATSGFVYRLRGDKVAWSFDALGGQDTDPTIRVIDTPAGIWVGCEQSKRLALLDRATGDVRWLLKADGRWSARSHKLFRLDTDALEIYHRSSPTKGASGTSRRS